MNKINQKIIDLGNKDKDTHLNAMFEAVEFPTGISDLNTGLTNVDRNALSHFRRFGNEQNDFR